MAGSGAGAVGSVNPSVSEEVQRYLAPFKISKAQLEKVKDLMLHNMEQGLKKQPSTLQMLPTFVRSTPDGTERGDFLVLDLGRAEPCIFLVRLDGSVKGTMECEKLNITEEMKTGEGVQLFDYVAECLGNFLQSRNLSQKNLPLGFTFAFACEQNQFDKGVLIAWTKDFHCPGVEGKDVVQLLKDAIDRRGDYKVDISVVVNDTVETMMTCGYNNHSCEVGLIIGTGTNVCYMEQMGNVEAVEGDEGAMCINVEWGELGDDGTLNNIATEYDWQVDKESVVPGKERFQKMISGMYLGEIVRNVLVELTRKGLLFGSVVSHQLCTKDSFSTLSLSKIENDDSSFKETKRILTSLGLNPSKQDCAQVQQVCSAVSQRSARLCAAGLAAVARRLRNNCQDPSDSVTTVGVDGYVYKDNPRFQEHLNKALKDFVPGCKFVFDTVEDCIGKGTAIVTAVAQRCKAKRKLIDEILAPFHMSLQNLRAIQSRMRNEMERGLHKGTQPTAIVKMLPTYVNATPDGKEKGEFIALDLGGSNFRVLYTRVGMKDAGEIQMVSKSFTLSKEVIQGTGEQLFNHIVNCITEFQKENGIQGKKLPLGFTFSFPCRQTSLDQGILISWTKGFSASGCVGEDVVRLLREAANRLNNHDFRVVALVNDTVGTMMSCGYDDPACEIGLIVGTGTNACYMEQMKNVEVLDGTEGRMCINMEWGAFGDNGCLDDITTSFDRDVDSNSINQGKQRYEKMISGMYLGEIVRQTLIELTEAGILFRGQISEKLNTRGLFLTQYLSRIESDTLGLLGVQAILTELGLDSTCDDAVLVKEVCTVVSKRAAQLCAAGIAAIVEKMRENRSLNLLKTTVGVDGTLYKLHPHFAGELQEMVKKLAPQCEVSFHQSEDGSGKGAALITAVACRVADAEPRAA